MAKMITVRGNEKTGYLARYGKIEGSGNSLSDALHSLADTLDAYESAVDSLGSDEEEHEPRSRCRAYSDDDYEMEES